MGELRDVDHSAWSVDDDGSIHYKFPGFNNAGGPVENDRLIGTVAQERSCEATCKAENNCHIFTHLFVSPWLRALACSKHHGCYSYDVVPEPASAAGSSATPTTSRAACPLAKAGR